MFMDSEDPQGYDILVLDAFTSGAIPMHLLTREAFTVYLKHLRSNGAIAVNISNSHLDLAPVLWGLADHFELGSALIKSKGFHKWAANQTSWMVLTRDQTLLKKLRRDSSFVARDHGAPTVLWTDDHSTLISVLN